MCVCELFLGLSETIKIFSCMGPQTTISIYSLYVFHG
jgi:hypothetical protein